MSQETISRRARMMALAASAGELAGRAPNLSGGVGQQAIGAALVRWPFREERRRRIGAGAPWTNLAERLLPRAELSLVSP